MENRKNAGGALFLFQEKSGEKTGENGDDIRFMHKGARVFPSFFSLSPHQCLFSHISRKNASRKARNDEKSRKKMDDPQNPQRHKSQIVKKFRQALPVSGKSIRRLSRRLSTKGEEQEMIAYDSFSETLCACNLKCAGRVSGQKKSRGICRKSNSFGFRMALRLFL